MLIPILLFILGLILLSKGGDWFVDGAVSLAAMFHIPDILIGATIVSIGTTLPEIMVSANSSFLGHGEIAYGNAIGSIICNTALIAAITITAVPSVVNRKSLKVPAIFFTVAALIYLGIAYTTGRFTRMSGIFFLAIFAVYVFVSYRQTKAGNADETDDEELEKLPLSSALIRLIPGAAAIAFGANLLVNNGTKIATAIGVPESVIALTMIALGTSLPELATAITSLRKGHGLLSLGNIIGANLFNIILVNGVAAAVAPYSIPQNSFIAGINASLVIDLPLMILVMALLILPGMIKGKLYRWQGISLLAIYAAFCVYQFTA